jgi:hypothetical protein
MTLSGSSGCSPVALQSNQIAKKFAVPYHALRRHARNHLTPEQKAQHFAGAALSRDELAEEVADESIGYLDHYRISRARIYAGLRVADEARDLGHLDRLTGRLHENLRDSARLTGDLQRGHQNRDRYPKASYRPD